MGAIKILYRVTIPRDWPTLAAMRLPKSRTVPKVLSPEKCWRIIHATKQLHGCVANWRVSQCNGAERLADATLVLQVKRSGSKQYKPMPLTVTEFIRRWLQHVVPSGFHRVRHYGFLNSHSRRTHEELELLIAAALGLLCYLFATPQIVCAEPMKMQCEYCGGCMISLGYFPPSSTNQGRAPP